MNSYRRNAIVSRAMVGVSKGQLGWVVIATEEVILETAHGVESMAEPTWSYCISAETFLLSLTTAHNRRLYFKARKLFSRNFVRRTCNWAYGHLRYEAKRRMHSRKGNSNCCRAITTKPDMLSAASSTKHDVVFRFKYNDARNLPQSFLLRIF